MNLAAILVIAALIVTIVSAVGRAPLWVAVLLIAIAMLIGSLGVR